MPDGADGGVPHATGPGAGPTHPPRHPAQPYDDRTKPVPHTTQPGEDEAHAVHDTSAPPDEEFPEFPAVAVTGMAGRFPGADDLDAFWENLAAGRGVRTARHRRGVLAAGGDPRDLDDPSLIRLASVVEGIDRFDSGFFGYSPAEAAVVDPQQRLLLETAYHALEDAGCLGGDRTGEAFGVYAGAGDSRYYPAHVYPRFAGQPGSVALVHAATANSLGTLATRLSYELGLTGPSVSLQTACSTALVAVHTACQDLLDHRCDTALAAAVSLNPSAVLGYRHVPDGPFSPDGHCRAFAADAAGTSSGDGVGAVVLKRLEDALADGDRVRAVIRGSAVNNDGRRKVGFSAPSAAGQTEVILAAQAQAEVDAGTIGLIEAHGTATKLGDPIEVSALTEAFRHSTRRTGFCALGSVKTNIGHLGAAAGIAGLIKAVLALEHRQIPPSLHFDRPNPLIDFDASPFRVPTALEEWPAPGHPRRAAVSAFGIGGTNAHVVLEEAPPTASDAPRPPEDGRRLSCRCPRAPPAPCAARPTPSPGTSNAAPDCAWTTSPTPCAPTGPHCATASPSRRPPARRPSTRCAPHRPAPRRPTTPSAWRSCCRAAAPSTPAWARSCTATTPSTATPSTSAPASCAPSSAPTCAPPSSRNGTPTTRPRSSGSSSPSTPWPAPSSSPASAPTR